ncbi:MAG TPA: tRNA 2-thiouridine(34) synthase MnmA [Syntrophomonas sp.]|jgi:tRNA-specific 2-thiouridylase|nr:tRNA 2-thiouridine(34) synthase MnmA [Syntrophomonas sp.]
MRTGVFLSGGVDSAVAALLLMQSGHEVLGITMVNWNPDITHKAVQIAKFLGITHHVVDLRSRFQEEVIGYFCDTYQRGATPNPCIRCNSVIKFGALLQYALEQGCDKIATGHYARIKYDAAAGLYSLHQGLDRSKDQSYFLYRLNQAQLARILFPLGELSKQEVWRLAEEHGIPIIKGQESQEICFIEGDYRDFLAERVHNEPGEIQDLHGNVIGRHRGLPYYTVGQRRGLGIAAAQPLYIVDLISEQNRIIAGPEEKLYQRALSAGDVNFIRGERPPLPLEVEAKIRYRAPLSKAVVYPQQDGVRVEFAEPQRAITKGQSVVFYCQDQVLGGGIIEKGLKS